MSTPELLFHMRALSRVIYFVTDEEDRFLVRLKDTLKAFADRTWVYNATMGLQPINDLINDWSRRQNREDADTLSIHNTLLKIYRDDTKERQHFYVITDPERWLSEAHVVRRVLNIIHQVHNDIRTLKVLIFVGSRKVIPESLSRYVEVVHDRGLTPEEITQKIDEACGYLNIKAPENAPAVFKGLTSYEVGMAIAQSIIKTKREPKGKRIDPAYIAEFRKRQIKKTDLLQIIDTAKYDFSVVGGLDRFKTWATKTRHSWTEKGQKFGLKPPKGVLLVGVWGCGKSLATKCLGRAWDLPVVQLEMGKLRSANVGQSEANVYKATRIIESVGACVVWVDEAEKSLSGGQSSAQSDAGTTSRTIGILSTWLQETDAPVCMAMTANSLTTLPIEFVNRMDERFFVDLPNEEDRIDILKIHLLKAGQDPTNYNLAALAEKASGMVGREIEQAIGAAMIDSFDAGKEALDEEILTQVLTSKPRIVKTMGDEVKEVISWVGWDEDIQDGIRARFASTPNRGGALKLVSDSDG